MNEQRIDEERKKKRCRLKLETLSVWDWYTLTMRDFGSPIFNIFFKVKADFHKRRSSFLVDQVRTCTTEII